MRKSIFGALAVVAVVAVAGAGASALIANAQPASPPASLEDPPPQGGPPWMNWMQRAHHWREMHGHRPVVPGTFALIHRQEDRQLAPADVQKIAEAFLLWNGNHSWKVTEVAPASDGSIGFALATPEGSVIARFAIDPHNGRVTRTA